MPGPAREGAVRTTTAETSSESPAKQALAMMTEALRLIDQDGTADVAGAHLDLAIHRLRAWIDDAEPK